MAIKELITLEGSEEVKKQLADLSQSGEAFVNSVNNLGTSGNPQLQQYFETIKSGTNANIEHGKSVSELTTLYHLLHPALTEAGASMGAFRGFAVAAHLGVAGLAAALGAALTVVLANVADETAATTQKLANLLKLTGPGAGQSIFSGLQADAAKLGTTVSTIEPVIESVIAALRKANAQGGAVFVVPEGQTGPAFFTKELDDAKNAALALDGALRKGGSTQAEAATEAKKFFDALGNAGKVTGDVVRQLNPLGGGILLVEKALNLSGLTAEQLAARLDKLPAPLKPFLVQLQLLKPAIDKALETGTPTRFSDALGRLTAAWKELLEVVANSRIFVGLVDFVAAIPGFLANDINAIKITFTDLATFLVSLWEPAKKAASAAWDFISKAATDAFRALTDDIAAAIKAWEKLFSDSATTLAAVWETIKTGAQDAWNFVSNLFAQTFSLDNWVNTFTSFFSSIKSLAQSAWDNIKSIFSVPIQPQVNLPSLQGADNSGLASGGMIRGPGTTTSDSILAWLSDREFVVNAKAVSHYGPDFFAALNAMRLPRDFGFSMGGLVRSMMGPMPRMASGGMVTAGATVNLVIGQNKFSLSASEDTAKKLKQFSISSQLSSAGRQPSWVR